MVQGIKIDDMEIPHLASYQIEDDGKGQSKLVAHIFTGDMDMGIEDGFLTFKSRNVIP
ncbi:MAG: hypothetical protein R3Y58_03415 [Eubacteriales bacterium]